VTSVKSQLLSTAFFLEERRGLYLNPYTLWFYSPNLLIVSSTHSIFARSTLRVPSTLSSYTVFEFSFELCSHLADGSGKASPVIPPHSLNVIWMAPCPYLFAVDSFFCSPLQGKAPIIISPPLIFGFRQCSFPPKLFFTRWPPFDPYF